jgi:hypothetical protein
MKKPGKYSLLLFAVVLGAACAQFAAAQQFRNVSVQGNAALAQVASGGNSVWALDTSGNPYLLEAGVFTKQESIALTQIAVGGGNSFQPDQVWALDASDHIYVASEGPSGYIFNQISGFLTQIVVGPGYIDDCHAYEVWGINSAGAIFRFDSCNAEFVNVPGVLSQISVGGGDVWGVNKSSKAFKLDFSTFTFNAVPGKFTHVSVGPNGVWALNAAQDVYQLNLATQKFAIMPNQSLTQISAGGNGVWGINSAGHIFRLDNSTQSFVQIAGGLASISVGTGGGVWGVNSAHDVFVFTNP